MCESCTAPIFDTSAGECACDNRAISPPICHSVASGLSGEQYAADKTTTDHALSYMFNKDCTLARTFKLKKICKEINKENLILDNKHLNLKKTKKVYKKRVVKIKKINVPSMAY